MATLQEEGGVCKGIHIVAHSMGNYVLHYAIEHLASVCPHTSIDACDMTTQTLAAATPTSNLSRVGAVAASPAGMTEAGVSKTAGEAAAAAAEADVGTRPSQAAGSAAVNGLQHQQLGIALVPEAQPVGLSPVVAAINEATAAAAATAAPGQSDAAVTSGSTVRSAAGPVAEGIAADAAGYSADTVDDKSAVKDTTAAAAGVTAATSTAKTFADLRIDSHCCEQLAASPFVTSGNLKNDEDHHHEDGATHAGVPAGAAPVPKDRPMDEGALMHHASSKQLFALLKTVIHAAADVSREDMETTISTVRTGARIHGTPQPQITLYASRRDQALCVSSILRVIGRNKDGRAGFFMRLPSWREGHLFHPFLFKDVICVDATGRPDEANLPNTPQCSIPICLMSLCKALSILAAH